MGNIKLMQKYKLHNTHHLVLKDGKTGKIKQEGWAYNVILDQGMDSLMLHLYDNSTSNTATNSPFGTDTGRGSRAWLTDTLLGEGTGTIANNRTTMFNYLDYKKNIAYDAGVNLSEFTAYNTRLATWEPHEIQHSNITEVSMGYTTTPRTHALIVDSEGNPITVAKGEFDVLSVYSTVYLSFVIDASHDSNVRCISGAVTSLVALDGHFFLNWLAENEQPQRSTSGSLDNFYFSPGIANNQSIASAFTMINSRNVNLGMDQGVYSNPAFFVEGDSGIVYTNDPWNARYHRRFQSSEENEMKVIRDIAVSGRTKDGYGSMALISFPSTGLFTGYSVVGEEVGTGDGVETEYDLAFPMIENESDAIYVNDVLQTRGTDYTIYNGVPKGQNILSYGAIYPFRNDEGYALIANAEKSAFHVSAKHYRDLLTDERSIFETHFLIADIGERPGGVYDIPRGIMFDLKLAQYADKFRIQNSTTVYNIKNFTLEGSNDLSSWTEILNTDCPNSTEWHEFSFTEAQYRYWRFTHLSTHNTSTPTSGHSRWYGFELTSERSNIVFNTAPADGHSIVANYDLDYLPKDENHVLDIDFYIDFEDGSA